LILGIHIFSNNVIIDIKNCISSKKKIYGDISVVKNTITDISNSIVDIKNSYPGYESKLKRLAITHRPIHQLLSKNAGLF